MTRLTLDINFVDLSVSGKSKYAPRIATSPGETRGAFTTASGQRYHVDVYGAPTAGVSFRNASQGDYKQSFGVTGTGGSDTPHIFHAVNHIIREHVRNNPSVSVVHFEASSHSPSRVKLYKAFANRVDPNHKHVPGKVEHKFYVNANAFRDPR